MKGVTGRRRGGAEMKHKQETGCRDGSSGPPKGPRGEETPLLCCEKGSGTNVHHYKTG